MPFIFSRQFTKENFNDQVVVGLGVSVGEKTIDVSKVFGNNVILLDKYSGKSAVVKNGKLVLDTNFDIVLLEIQKQ